jgi:outer membrane protein OmpA-like peptidoglycan-associated protein
MRRFRTGFSRLQMIILLNALCLVVAQPVEAQLGDRIIRSAKQKLEERKERTKENVVQRATEPVDSTLERVAAPVDSVVGRAAAGAAVAVSRVGRSRAAEVEVEARRLSDELAATGRVEVPGIAFVPGMEQLGPGSETYVSALAAALNGAPGAFLIEGRAGTDEDGTGGRTLGGLRAAAVKASLVAEGVADVQLFAAGHAAEGDGVVPITVVRME